MRLITLLLAGFVASVPAAARSRKEHGCPSHAFAMRLNTRLVAVLGLLSGLVLADTTTQAQSWVSGVGSDANNPCTRTAPCKTFAVAISQTAAGGEVDCLDPGGFDTAPISITKAITLDCSGTFGLIQVSGTNAINVAAGPSDKVIIRGLSFSGGIHGIDFSPAPNSASSDA
jgi:hypothetical protein